MKRGTAGGFTIVETMIVLGVMSVLFISMLSVVRGQQGKAEFRTSVTDIVTQIQSYIAQVSTGYYAKSGQFSCTASAGDVTLTTTTGSALGTNDSCTYMGQAVMLGVPGPTSDNQQFVVHTLVGARKATDGSQPRTLRQSDTQVLAKGIAYNTAINWPDLASTKSLHYGSRVETIKARNGDRNLAGFAVVASPSSELSFNTSTDQLDSGTIIPIIMPILNDVAGPYYGVTPKKGVDLIIRSLGNAPDTLAADAFVGPIDICVSSGTTNQSAVITLGTNNSATSIDYVVNNGPCAP